MDIMLFKTEFGRKFIGRLLERYILKAFGLNVSVKIDDFMAKHSDGEAIILQTAITATTRESELDKMLGTAIMKL